MEIIGILNQMFNKINFNQREHDASKNNNVDIENKDIKNTRKNDGVKIDIKNNKSRKEMCSQLGQIIKNKEEKTQELWWMLKEGQVPNQDMFEENQMLNEKATMLEKDCNKHKRVIHDVLARDKITRGLKIEVLRLGSSLHMVTEK